MNHPVISSDDWKRSIIARRKESNSVSQQMRLKLGWPTDFNFSLRARSDAGDYALVFENDLCTKLGHLAHFPPMDGVLGCSYDHVASTLRSNGFALERIIPKTESIGC